jgi:hypothetical protein
LVLAIGFGDRHASKDDSIGTSKRVFSPMLCLLHTGSGMLSNLTWYLHTLFFGCLLIAASESYARWSEGVLFFLCQALFSSSVRQSLVGTP